MGGDERCRTVHRFLMWVTQSEATQMSTGEHLLRGFHRATSSNVPW
jgi:hypothetical protein